MILYKFEILSIFETASGLHTINTSIHKEYTIYLYHRTLSQWEDELMNGKATDEVADLLTLL